MNGRSLLYACARSAVLKEPRRVAFFAAASALNAAGQGVVAAVAGALCRALIGGPSPNPALSNHLNFLGSSALSPVGWAVLGLVAIGAKVVGGVVAAYEESRIAGEVGVELRGAVLDAWLGGHLLRRARQVDHGPSRETEKNDDAIGEDAQGVAALTARVREIEMGLAHGALGGARAIAQLVPLAFVLISLAPSLAGVAIAILAVFSLVLGIGRAAFKREQRRLAGQHDALLEGADEAIRHADLWRTYGAQEKARAHIARIGSAIATHSARLEARASAWSGANEILGALALVLALLAARAGFLGANSVASLLPFSVAFFLTYRPLRELAEARIAWTRANVASEDIDARSARAPIADHEISSRIVTSWKLETLDLRDVTLPHGLRAPFSLVVQPGSIVAVVGANGSGKTTLLRVLLGLLRAGSGAILYGDQRIENAATGPLARPFAWVPQDAPILADTIFANVMLGGNEPSARAALVQMGLSDLTKTLGAARLGAAGRSISGGEKRLIAIARALASELPVLLLDEPTSGLDDAAKKRLLTAISNLRGTRTVILVTHAPEPQAIADQVIRLGENENRASRVA